MSKSLYDAEDYQEILERVHRLEDSSQATWGEMSTAQMFAHCAEVTAVMSGRKTLKNSPFFLRLLAPMIRRAVFGAKPYPKSSPTHPQYRIAEQKDFQKEKDALLAELEYFYEQSNDADLKIRHPFLGGIDFKDRGWGAYKHLDHHLQQFGV